MHHRLKELRKALDLTQAEFARRIGLGQSSLAMLEQGKRALNEKHIKLICAAFAVREQWLRTGEGEMFAASPYEGEFLDLFAELRPESQQYLLFVARKLVETQNRLLRDPSAQ